MRTRNVQKVVSRIEPSRLRESVQGNKWSFCLTAGKIDVLRPHRPRAVLHSRGRDGLPVGFHQEDAEDAA